MIRDAASDAVEMEHGGHKSPNSLISFCCGKDLWCTLSDIVAGRNARATAESAVASNAVIPGRALSAQKLSKSHSELAWIIRAAGHRNFLSFRKS